MEHKELPTETQTQLSHSEVTISTISEPKDENLMLPDENYSQLNIQDLVKAFEKLVLSGDMLSISNQIKVLKEHFTELTKEEYNAKLSKYIEDGGEKEDFSPVKSSEEQKFEELLKKYNKQKAAQISNREKQLGENLNRKKELIEEIKRIADNATNVAQNYKRIQEIQTLWKEIGQVPTPQADELWKNYKFNVDRYFDLLHLNNELRELNFKRNFELKTELCEKAEKLIDEPSLRKALETLRTLQEHWRDTGFAGKLHNDEALERFKAAEQKIIARKKVQQLELSAKMEENLKVKNSLCKELQALNNTSRKTHKEWQNANEQLEQIWDRWRKAGPVPDSDNDNCWKQFKQYRQEFYHLKDAFYVSIREEQNANLLQRIALCEKAEALQTSTEWGKTAETLKKLQDEWKKIGPAPKHKSDKIWNRFRNACDSFFNNRKSHFSNMDAKLEQNADNKRSIIQQIKNLEINADVDQNIENIRTIQQAWIQSGKAPEKSFRHLNQDYKKALEDKIEQIQQSLGIDHAVFNQIRYEHLLLSDEGKNELHKERTLLNDKVKKLRHEISTQENNLSFFGKSKSAAALLSEYTKKIESMKVELKIMEKQLKSMPFV